MTKQGIIAELIFIVGQFGYVDNDSLIDMRGQIQQLINRASQAPSEQARLQSK